MATFLRRDDWVTDAMGNALSGTQVYVCSQPATTGSIPPSPLVQLYSDPAGAFPITQPVLTDGYGHAAYYVTPGTYTVVYYSPQILEQVLPDQTIGSGNVAFPITIAEGGTNATTAAQARINLGAAASGANSDITSLAALVSTPTATAISIGPGAGSSGGTGGIFVTDGIHTSVWELDGQINCGGLATGGSIVCGPLQCSNIVTGGLTNGTPGSPITVGQSGAGEISLEIGGNGTTQQCLLGFNDYPTQLTVGSAGSGSALPSAPSFYLQMYVAGTSGVAAGVYVCPFYKVS